GPGWLYAIVNGVASQGVFVQVGGVTTGIACAVDGECDTGHCVDNVCCNEACTGGCQACIKQRTLTDDGTCGDIAQGGEPRSGCEPQPDNVCGPTGVCDGQGACEVAPPTQRCSLRLGPETQPPGICVGGFCEKAPSTACSDDGLAVVAPGLSPESCGAFR